MGISDNLTDEQIEFLRENGFNVNGKGKSKKKKEIPIIISEKEIERNKILKEISNSRQDNPDLTFEEWSNVLKKNVKISITKSKNISLKSR